jgi:hypothetical protein
MTFAGQMRGRPLARNVDSSSSLAAVSDCHLGLPYGLPRLTLACNASSSADVSGRLVVGQFESRYIARRPRKSLNISYETVAKKKKPPTGNNRTVNQNLTGWLAGVTTSSTRSE